MPPRVSQSRESVYMGIDPGEKGAIATIVGGTVTLTKMPATDGDIWCQLGIWKQLKEVTYEARPPNWHHRLVLCVVERIDPRPTEWMDKKTGKWTQSILKSTCTLYGCYCTVTALLLAAGIPHEVVGPKEWQKALGLRRKKKGEKPSAWKNYLKSQAQALYPTEKITLDTCDALLLAHYCRKKQEGTLGGK